MRQTSEGSRRRKNDQDRNPLGHNGSGPGERERAARRTGPTEAVQRSAERTPRATLSRPNAGGKATQEAEQQDVEAERLSSMRKQQKETPRDRSGPTSNAKENRSRNCDERRIAERKQTRRSCRRPVQRRKGRESREGAAVETEKEKRRGAQLMTNSSTRMRYHQR